MNRLDRLTSILIQLQSKRLITAREMAERFEVTNRTYQTRGEELLKERTIQPYAVYFSGAVWTTIAFCELRQEIREFRLDRIKSLHTTHIRFEPDRTFSMERYLETRSKRLFSNP